MAATDAAVVQEANNAIIATGTTITVALTGVVAGNTLEVFAGCGSGTGVSMTCADALTAGGAANGSYGSPLFQKVPGTATIRVAAWVFPNSVGGNITITITFSATITARSVWVKELKNVGPARDGTADATSQLTPGTGTDGVTGSLTLSSTPGFISALCYHVVTTVATIAAGTGWTNGVSGWAFASSGGGRSESRRFTSTGSKAATFTTNVNSEHDVLVIGYDEAPTMAAAGVLPGLTGAATLTESLAVTAAGVLPGLAGAAVVTESQSAAVAGVLPGLVGAATLEERLPLTAAGVLPGLSASATLTEALPLSVAGVLPGLTGSAVVEQSLPATAGGVLPGLTGAAALTEELPLSVAGVLPGLTGAATVGVEGIELPSTRPTASGWAKTPWPTASNWSKRAAPTANGWAAAPRPSASRWTRN